MSTQDAIAQRITAYLSRVTAKHGLSIADETEIYYDLWLYGDDLYELFLWLHQGFGIEVHENIFYLRSGRMPNSADQIATNDP